MSKLSKPVKLLIVSDSHGNNRGLAAVIKAEQDADALLFLGDGLIDLASAQRMSRRAQLYLLDEPIGGVDPAARDYILQTILSNYREDATVVISTHLIADVEQVLDQVIFLRSGTVQLCTSVDEIRAEHGCSVDAFFREVYKC